MKIVHNEMDLKHTLLIQSLIDSTSSNKIVWNKKLNEDNDSFYYLCNDKDFNKIQSFVVNYFKDDKISTQLSFRYDDQTYNYVPARHNNETDLDLLNKLVSVIQEQLQVIKTNTRNKSVNKENKEYIDILTNMCVNVNLKKKESVHVRFLI